MELVHGLTIHPVTGVCTVTCDGCGDQATSEGSSTALVILTCGIIFNPRVYNSGDQRRLCAPCRATAWPEN